MDLDQDLEAIQVIHLDPHRECIQTGANDRIMVLVVAMQVIPDLEQTRVVHLVISVEVVVAILVVVIPVVGTTMVVVVVVVVMQVIPVVVIPVVVIPVVVMQVIQVVIQEDI